jgi:hypothetical protein
MYAHRHTTFVVLVADAHTTFFVLVADVMSGHDEGALLHALPDE